MTRGKNPDQPGSLTGTFTKQFFETGMSGAGARLYRLICHRLLKAMLALVFIGNLPVARILEKIKVRGSRNMRSFGVGA